MTSKPDGGEENENAVLTFVYCGEYLGFMPIKKITLDEAKGIYPKPERSK